MSSQGLLQPCGLEPAKWSCLGGQRSRRTVVQWPETSWVHEYAAGPRFSLNLYLILPVYLVLAFVGLAPWDPKVVWVD